PGRRFWRATHEHFAKSQEAGTETQGVQDLGLGIGRLYRKRPIGDDDLRLRGHGLRLSTYVEPPGAIDHDRPHLEPRALAGIEHERPLDSQRSQSEVA